MLVIQILTIQFGRLIILSVFLRQSGFICLVICYLFAKIDIKAIQYRRKYVKKICIIIKTANNGNINQTWKSNNNTNYLNISIYTERFGLNIIKNTHTAKCYHNKNLIFAENTLSLCFWGTKILCTG